MAGPSNKPPPGFNPEDPEWRAKANAANRDKVVQKFSEDAVKANQIPEAPKQSTGGKMMDNLVKAAGGNGDGNFASTRQTNEETYSKLAKNVGDCSGNVQRADLLMLNRFAQHGQVIGNTLTPETKASVERAVDSCLNVGRIGPGSSPG